VGANLHFGANSTDGRVRSATSRSFRSTSAIWSEEVSRPSDDPALELLLRELQHRIRNLLSVVQCFVSDTDANTADGYRAALTERLAALSGSLSFVEGACEHRVSLEKLIERTLKPHAMGPNERIVLAGPDVTLEPHSALSLHLVLHELATNACKHGALVAASGTVEICWDAVSEQGDRALAIQWREQGGPAVRKPQRMGFGMRLISKALVGARVDMDFAPAGLVCRILLQVDPSTVQREAITKVSPQSHGTYRLRS
jgi:two-component sensor histidine kinase